VAKGRSGKGKSKLKRVAFRQNRLKPARQKQWDVPDEHNEAAEDTLTRESVRTKGALSRRRTVADRTETTDLDTGGPVQGIAIAVRGQLVEVDDGQRVWPCTVRRILRTRLIKERHPVVVGDDVSFSIVADSEGLLNEGVIEEVSPRRTALLRSDGHRTHVIAANVDQTLIVSSIREPMIKPHLIDRYLVAAHAGHLEAIICVNKIDLDEEGEAQNILDRYTKLGYVGLATSIMTGAGIDKLRSLLAGRLTMIVGQSGVGKSSLLNVVEPGLDLKTAHVSTTTDKGRHTTTTAVWLKLANAGGVVIDTPGIRALDVAMVPLNELEMHFVEFVGRVADCKYPNCVHIHENECVIKAAVEAGQIDRSRYESYVELFYELSEVKKY